VLLGPSGCGKTTTLRMIAGLELPTSGQILIDGEDVTALRARQRDIAFVFQMFALYPHMTVRNNIAFPLKNEGISRAQIAARVDAAAQMLRIETLLDRKTGGLSGGDRQRVALGRAIVRHPKAFLMDEPLGTLDADFRELMCLELRKLHNALTATTVYVTHDQSEAMAMADDIVVMNRGEVLQSASPHEIYHFPATVFVGSFIGSPPMNFLRGTTRSQNGTTRVEIGGQALQAPAGVAQAGDVLVGIRAENIQASASAPSNGSTALQAETIVVEPLGSHLLVTATVEGQLLKVVTSTDFPVRAGMPIWLEPEPDKLRWLRAADGMAFGV